MSLIVAVALIGAIESFPFRGGETPSPEPRDAATSPSERPAPTAPRPLIDVERPSSSGDSPSAVPSRGSDRSAVRPPRTKVAGSEGPRQPDRKAIRVPSRRPAAPPRMLLPERDQLETAPPRLGNGLWAASWTEVPGTYDWISPMIWIDGHGIGDDSWTSREYFAPEVVAARLAELPAGRRSLFIWRYRHSLLDHPMDRLRAPDGTTFDLAGPFVNAGAASMRTEWEPFVDRLAQIGPAPDFLILDVESSGRFKSWNLPESTIAAILEDPRFESTDLKNGQTPKSMTGDWSAEEIKQQRPRQAPADYNAAIDRIFSRALEDSILEPARSRWPDLQASNYGNFRIDRDETSPDMNGTEVWGDAVFGTHAALEFYGRLRGLCTHYGPDPANPTSIVRTSTDTFEPSGWLALIVDVNRARSMNRSDSGDHHAWIAAPDWRTDGNATSFFENSPYWRENIFQQAMAGASLFLFWNPKERQETLAQTQARIDQARTLDEVLAELDAETRGATSFEPIDSTRIPMTTDSILSGARLPDDSRIWRMSVGPNVRAARLRVGDRGVTLTFGDDRGAWISSGPGEAVTIIRTIDFKDQDQVDAGSPSTTAPSSP
jgi:hypothetical protein